MILRGRYTRWVTKSLLHLASRVRMACSFPRSEIMAFLILKGCVRNHRCTKGQTYAKPNGPVLLQPDEPNTQFNPDNNYINGTPELYLYKKVRLMNAFDNQC